MRRASDAHCLSVICKAYVDSCYKHYFIEFSSQPYEISIMTSLKSSIVCHLPSGLSLGAANIGQPSQSSETDRSIRFSSAA